MMMKDFMRGLVAGALLGFCAQADAADLRTPLAAKAPPYVANIDPYTGFSVGGEVGYGFNLGNTGCAFPGGVCDLGDLSAAPQGFVGGGFIGWGTRVPGLLAGLGLDGYFGIEGGADIGNLSGNSATGFKNLAITAKTDWLARAGIRLGLIYQNVMFYGFLGEGWGGATGDLVFGNGVAAGSASSTQNGLTWGGGVEFPWFFGPNWTARLQYLQYDFGTLSIPISGLPGFVVTQKDRIDDITVGLRLKF